MQSCPRPPLTLLRNSLRRPARHLSAASIPVKLPRFYLRDSTLIPGGYRYSSSSDPNLPLAEGAARLRSRSVLLLSGPDAAKYLQGAITFNVNSFHPVNNSARVGASETEPVQAPFYTAFLNPQGRVLHDVFIYPFAGNRPVDDQNGLDLAGEGASGEQSLSFLIDGDASEAENLRRWIAKYRLRSRFDVSRLPNWQVWALWGGRDRYAIKDRLPFLGRGLSCEDRRSEDMGIRYVAPASEQQPDPSLESPSSETAYKVRRYLRGIPEGQKEILPGQALPLESNHQDQAYGHRPEADPASCSRLTSRRWRRGGR